MNYKKNTLYYGIINIMMYIVSVFLAVNSIFPPMKAIPGITLITFIFMFVWIFLAFTKNPFFFIKMPFHRLLTFVFILYTVLVPYLLGNDTIGNRYLAISQIFLFYIIYVFYRDHGKQKYNIGIIKWVIPFLIYSAVKTVLALCSNPFISRSIKSHGEYSLRVSSQGIGGYELIYFLTLFCIIQFYISFIHKEKTISKKMHILNLMMLALFSTVIVLSNYFTALVICVTSIILLLFIKFTNGTNILKRLAGIYLIILIIIYIKRISIFVVRIAITTLNPGKTLDRITAIYQKLQFGSDVALLDSRILTLHKSLDALSNNPVLGLISKKIEFDTDGYLVGFGQHSQILDTFALFGIFIGIAQIYILCQPYFIRIKNSGIKDLPIVLMIAMMTLFFMNNVTASIGLVLFLIFPTIHDELELRKNISGAV